MNLYISPHPPILLQAIGKGEEKKAQKTIYGLQKIASDIAREKPKTIVIVTPHGNVFSDALCINKLDTLEGDFSRFGHREIRLSYQNDTQKSSRICKSFIDNGISCLSLNHDSAKSYRLDINLDHGALVPLYFISQKYKGFKLIHITIGFLSKTEMYEAGRVMAEALDEGDVIVISGDMSHKLSDSGPYRYDKMGSVYDKYIMEALESRRYIDILDIDAEMLERAGQCAQKPLEMMIGAFEGYETQSEIYSYEGPYGVGYMTAKISRKKKGAPSVMHEYMLRKTENYETMKRHDNDFVDLAIKTIHEYVKNNVKLKVPDGLAPEMYKDRSGVFVSIKKEGRLRGCIGTISPTQENIAHEIVENAISAAARDPRFNPIEPHELSELSVSVDILFPAEDIKSKDELDVEKYGVIVANGYRRGLLLPNLEGVDTVDYQIEVALQKAGISPEESYTMQRFKVVRHK